MNKTSEKACNSTLLYWLRLISCSLSLFGGYVNGFGQNGNVAKNYIQNWQVFHNEGDYDEAIEQAKLIYNLGNDTQNQELMAYTLNWEAQSLLKIRRRLSANRRIAKKALKESLDLLENVDNTDLKLDNLRRLRMIARIEGDRVALDAYTNRMETIKERLETQASNEVLTERVELLDSEKEALQEQVASLSAAQMETELMIARQQNMLDSLEMLRMKSAFLLEKNEMERKEQAAQLELQESQLALQQKQLQLQASQRNLFIALAVLLLLMAIGGYLRYVETRKYNLTLEEKNEALNQERQKSDNLLLNILPVTVAEELKNTGFAKAQRYDKATVMFADFKNFSQIAKSMSPEKLVAELDLYFKAFDEIVKSYHIEKIKTIGDAYMCVGGLPDKEGNHPKDVVMAALEIQQLLAQLKEERIKNGQPYFEARIGIHTGPLVAGVVGSTKFAYDIWGDTVNIASRMESNGEPWQVNVSSSTYELVKDYFSFEYRGIIPIKNRGEIEMYFAREETDKKT